jgi:hypothetical protein
VNGGGRTVALTLLVAIVAVGVLATVLGLAILVSPAPQSP